MTGAGKYDPICTAARLATKAEGLLLCVLGGELGDGFSVQATPEQLEKLVPVLRTVADQIEADLKRGIPEWAVHLERR